MTQMIVDNPNKTKRYKELGPVDISSIKDDILNLSEEYWDIYDPIKPNSFEVFNGTTKHIVFKFISDYDHPFPDIIEYPIWSDWKNKLEPIMKAVTEQYGYSESTFGKVMLAKLRRGAKIGLHEDTPISSAYPHKIHIPISTNPGVKFFIDNLTYHLEVGQAYEVNNRTIHGGANEGDSDRIHLIFCLYDRKLNVVKAEEPESITAQLLQQVRTADAY